MKPYYILDGKIPKQVDNVLEWGKFFQNEGRIVKSDMVNGVHVSTVFLGIDHSWDGGDPILFETMIFGGEQDGYQERYCTWEEAEKGHQVAIELLSSEPLAQ